MYQPLEWFIGFRYLRSARGTLFVSFISLASMLGIAVGVAALIVILSVMNGFETELRTRLLSMTSHATLSDPKGRYDGWQGIRDQFATDARVIGTAPFLEVEGMLANGQRLNPARVRGILPGEEGQVSQVAGFMDEGSLDDLVAGERRMILGRVLALNLEARPGSRINLLVPRLEGGRIAPKLTGFVVSGIFEAGLADHDGSLALINLDDAQALFGGAPGLRLRLADPLNTAPVAASVAETLSDLDYTDWTIENRSYFRAIRIEKTMMTLILLLIVAVAAFNIVASLMMVVTDKQMDIAILRTLGLEPRRVGRLFLIQGGLIGVSGTLLGLALGVLLTVNVDVLVPWLERTFQFQIMPGDVYYVTAIPAEIHALDLIVIPMLALVVSIIATIYPSRRAAAVAPAAALRYE
jgi:lipoprotein-releasing system permease protein